MLGRKYHVRALVINLGNAQQNLVELGCSAAIRSRYGGARDAVCWLLKEEGLVKGGSRVAIGLSMTTAARGWIESEGNYLLYLNPAMDFVLAGKFSFPPPFF
jgi:hypothetical protein